MGPAHIFNEKCDAAGGLNLGKWVLGFLYKARAG